jgi:MFS family permease
LTYHIQWTFVAFFVLFEIGSLICGVATSSNMLIVGRAIAGMGTSGILNGAFTIIAGCVPMAKRPSVYLYLISDSSITDTFDSSDWSAYW